MSNQRRTSRRNRSNAIAKPATKAVLGTAGNPFKLQTFHIHAWLGHILGEQVVTDIISAENFEKFYKHETSDNSNMKSRDVKKFGAAVDTICDLFAEKEEDFADAYPDHFDDAMDSLELEGDDAANLDDIVIAFAYLVEKLDGVLVTAEAEEDETPAPTRRKRKAKVVQLGNDNEVTDEDEVNPKIYTNKDYQSLLGLIREEHPLAAEKAKSVCPFGHWSAGLDNVAKRHAAADPASVVVTKKERNMNKFIAIIEEAMDAEPEVIPTSTSTEQKLPTSTGSEVVCTFGTVIDWLNSNTTSPMYDRVLDQLENVEITRSMVPSEVHLLLENFQTEA